MYTDLFFCFYALISLPVGVIRCVLLRLPCNWVAIPRAPLGCSRSCLFQLHGSHFCPYFPPSRARGRRRLTGDARLVRSPLGPALCLSPSLGAVLSSDECCFHVGGSGLVFGSPSTTGNTLGVGRPVAPASPFPPSPLGVAADARLVRSPSWVRSLFEPVPWCRP